MGGVILERFPITIKRDDAGQVGRDREPDQVLNRCRDELQNTALLDHRNALKSLYVIRMNRKECGVIIDALGHVAVILSERHEILLDGHELLWGLVQKPVCDYEFDVSRRNFDLLEAVFNATDVVGDVGEAATIEDGLLDAGHKTEAQLFADFADLSQKR